MLIVFMTKTINKLSILSRNNFNNIYIKIKQFKTNKHFKSIHFLTEKIERKFENKQS